MKAFAILAGALVSFSAAGDDSSINNGEPSVEILGVQVTRGMPEAAVRDALPGIYCLEQEPKHANINYCSVSDGVPPDADGEVSFRDGVVYSASRNWFIPDGAQPLEVMIMLNEILTRLIGDENAACAKIETRDDQEPKYTIFALPKKVLTVQMHTMPGRSGAHFKESLRVNPVPDDYKTRGKQSQGAEWCVYAR